MDENRNEKIQTLPSHLLNIFRLARDFYTHYNFSSLNPDHSFDTLSKHITQQFESNVVDYLFKNFKTPIRIHTNHTENPIENREGEIDFSFVILPLNSMDNFLNQIRLCGFGIYVYDASQSPSFTNVYSSLISNLYTGDYLLTTPSQEVYLNNYLFENKGSMNKEHPIISCSFNSTLTLPTLKRILLLLKKYPHLRSFGSPIIESMMVLMNQTDSFLDLTCTVPFLHQLCYLSIFYYLKSYIHTEAGDAINAMAYPMNESLPFIVSPNISLQKRILKTLKKRV